jgi:hypothetical protein
MTGTANWVKCDGACTQVCDISEVLNCRKTQYALFYKKKPGPMVNRADLKMMAMYNESKATSNAMDTSSSDSEDESNEIVNAHTVTNAEKEDESRDSSDSMDSDDSSSSKSFSKAKEWIDNYKKQLFMPGGNLSFLKIFPE